jgi:hypothetical protein
MPFDGTGFEIIDDRAVFARAAELIRERGWATGEPEDQRGRLCLIGALAVVTGRERFCMVDPEIERLVRRLGFASIEAAWRWNDLLLTFGKRRVIRRLRLAAA